MVFYNFHIQHNLAQNSEMCQKLPILMVNKVVKNWTAPKSTYLLDQIGWFMPFYEVKCSIFEFYLSDFGSTFYIDRGIFCQSAKYIVYFSCPWEYFGSFLWKSKINTKGSIALCPGILSGVDVKILRCETLLSWATICWTMFWKLRNPSGIQLT